MDVLELNDDNFQEEASEGLVLVDFYADWCGPCRMVSPVIDQISKETDDVKVVKVDVDSSPETAGRYGIRSIPTVILLNDGEIVDKKIGAMPKMAYMGMIENAV